MQGHQEKNKLQPRVEQCSLHCVSTDPRLAFRLVLLPSLLRFLRFFCFFFPPRPLQLAPRFFRFISFLLFSPCPSPCTVYVFFLLHVSAPLLSGPRLGPPHFLMHDLLIHSSLINIHLYTLSTHSSLPLLSILPFFPSPSLAADIGVGSAAPPCLL